MPHILHWNINLPRLTNKHVFITELESHVCLNLQQYTPAQIPQRHSNTRVQALVKPLALTRRHTHTLQPPSSVQPISLVFYLLRNKSYPISLKPTKALSGIPSNRSKIAIKEHVHGKFIKKVFSGLYPTSM